MHPGNFEKVKMKDKNARQGHAILYKVIADFLSMEIKWLQDIFFIKKIRNLLVSTFKSQQFPTISAKRLRRDSDVHWLVI